MAYIDYGQTIIESAKEQRQKNEANAKAHTFNFGSQIPALLVSIVNPAVGIPMLLKSATAEAVRASTGSDADIVDAVNLADQFLPTAPATTPQQAGTAAPAGAEGPLMQGGQYFDKPQGNPFQQWMRGAQQGVGNLGYAPQTTAQQENAKLIASGKILLKSLTQDGRTYEREDPYASLLKSSQVSNIGSEIDARKVAQQLAKQQKEMEQFHLIFN